MFDSNHCKGGLTPFKFDNMWLPHHNPGSFMVGGTSGVGLKGACIDAKLKHDIMLRVR